MIEVTNERDYLDFVPEGMKPYCPGIELALPEGSESSLAAFENEFSHLCPNTIHCELRWQHGSKTARLELPEF